MKRCLSTKPHQRGQALLETALCLPVFFLLILGGLQLAILSELGLQSERAAIFASAAIERAGASPESLDAALDICEKVYLPDAATVTLTHDGTTTRVACSIPSIFPGFGRLLEAFHADSNGLLTVHATFSP